jgi:lysyl-tRNA synthetase class 2
MVAYVAQQVMGLTLTFSGANTIDLTPPWRRIPCAMPFSTRRHRLRSLPDAESLAAEMRRNAVMNPIPSSTWGKLVDSLIAKFVEPNLIQPTFLIDYPRDVSPLAKGSPRKTRARSSV